MAVNHVVYGGSTLIDLRNDTVTSAEHIMSGYVGHLADGTVVTGTGGGSPSGPTYGTYFDSSITVSNKEINIPSLSGLYFAEGETWRVTWDGDEYICNSEWFADASLYYIGNVALPVGADDGTGEPFCLYNLGWSNALVGDARTDGAHTLKLEKQTSSGGGTETNPLSGKIATFTGDSICAGYGYTGGYAGIIGTENGMTVENLGTGDGCITPYSNKFVISTSIANMRSDADFVILEGGANDAGYEIPLGSLTSGYNDTLNTNTFAGAFENMLKSAIAKFPSAKIGYIFIHKCEPNFDSRTSNSYYNVAKAACEKWGIPICDLNVCVPPLGYIADLTSTYLVDAFHPNELGYRTFYVPKITAFMKTMLTDYSLISKIVDENGTYLASDDNADGYNSVTVDVSSSGGKVKTGTFTPESASTTVSFDTGLTDIHGILIIPVDNPFTGSRTQYGMICIPSGAYFKSISIYTNQGGTGNIQPSTSTSSSRFSLSGTTVTVTGSYTWRTITYLWYAW